jgi:D-alanyl-D-alanine dipeptidase
MNQKLYILLILSVISMFNNSFALTEEARSKGFVYLHEIDPTIISSVRYASNENFLGRPVDGYKQQVIILTKQAAEALKKVQEEIQKDGYSLVVYDAYRPQKAVNDFYKWSQDLNDQVNKDQYYPRVDKSRVNELGYVGTKRSGHSRGSTVDLTIIKKNKSLTKIKKKDHKLLDGFTIKDLDDNTEKMGSSFDLFDLASHFTSDLIVEKYKNIRKYLRSVMEKHGFVGCKTEWWHFTLKNEPYLADQDSSYFDFDVE